MHDLCLLRVSARAGEPPRCPSCKEKLRVSETWLGRSVSEPQTTADRSLGQTSEDPPSSAAPPNRLAYLWAQFEDVHAFVMARTLAIFCCFCSLTLVIALVGIWLFLSDEHARILLELWNWGGLCAIISARVYAGRTSDLRRRYPAPWIFSDPTFDAACFWALHFLLAPFSPILKAVAGCVFAASCLCLLFRLFTFARNITASALADLATIWACFYALEFRKKIAALRQSYDKEKQVLTQLNVDFRQFSMRHPGPPGGLGRGDFAQYMGLMVALAAQQDVLAELGQQMTVIRDEMIRMLSSAYVDGSLVSAVAGQVV